MKKLFISILLLAMLPFAAVEAQDARGRVTSTIVADALNQLPAEDAGLYNRLMGELAATGSEGVEMIASMLKPAAEGVNNSPMEYALNGVAWYVTESGNASLRDGVREGLRNAADKCGDPTTKAFLLTVLERCATAEDAGYFAALLGDEYQGDFAARALATLPGTEPTVLSLMQEQNANGLSRARLAHIASYKNMEGAEDILLAWAAEGGEDAEMAEIHRALASCGTAKSVKALGAAAKAVDYAFETTDAYASYVALLTKLSKTDPAAALKAAKKLMKASPKVNVRSAGLEIVARVEGADVLPVLEKAMKEFGLRLDGYTCADIGASTGGFTDCMLQNGAVKVYAIDVGYGQLAWKLRCDDRVVNLERTNIRHVTEQEVPELLDFASVDVSFISLKLVLPVLYRLLKDGGEAVCLIKPQFEAGRELVGKKGVVREESTHVMVVENALSNAKENGFTPIHLTFSPVKGPEGNIEYLMHLKKGGYEAELPAPEEIVRLSHMTLSE